MHPRLRRPGLLAPWLVVTTLGCAPPAPPAAAGGPPVLSSRRTFARHVGNTVTVVGRAESNYKDGAMLVARDGGRVRVAGHTKWPAELAGRTVAATGKLEYQPYDPALDHVAYAADSYFLSDVDIRSAVVVEAPTTRP